MTYRNLPEGRPVRPRGRWGGLLILAITFALWTASFLAAVPAQDQKLKPDELIARHLDAIGSAEARAAAKSRVTSGAVTLTLRIGGAGGLSGDGMLVSSGPRLRFGMKFRSLDYPGEDIVFDGARAAAGFLPKGGRSQLSAFLTQQESPLKEGLLGGVLSTAWPLLRLDQQQPKLEYRGLKKVSGRDLHELSYRPRKGGSDLKIALYFDPATFRHVRTQYSFQIGATIGTRESANLNPESYYSLTEEFDDFRVADGLTMPHKYRLQLSVQSGTTSALYDYTLAVSRVAHNEVVDAQVFTLK